MILNINARLVFGASVLLILIFLKLFTNVSDSTIIAIAIIAAFLMIFSYVFKTEGLNSLSYLGVFNSFSNPWGGIILAFLVVLFGITAIITIVKLNHVEIAYDKIDEK